MSIHEINRIRAAYDARIAELKIKLAAAEADEAELLEEAARQENELQDALVRAETAEAALAAMTAERDGLRKDAERLDYIIASGSYVVSSRDGDDCWLMQENDDEEGEPHLRQCGVYANAREAIDAALSRSAAGTNETKP